MKQGRRHSRSGGAAAFLFAAIFWGCLPAAQSLAGFADKDHLWPSRTIPVCWARKPDTHGDFALNQRFLPLYKFLKEVAVEEYARAGFHLVGWDFCSERIRVHQVRIAIWGGDVGDKVAHSDLGPTLGKEPTMSIHPEASLYGVIFRAKYPADTKKLQKFLEEMRKCTSGCGPKNIYFGGLLLTGGGVQQAMHLMVHELGHSLGLRHEQTRLGVQDKAEQEELESCRKGKGRNESKPDPSPSFLEMPAGIDRESVMYYCSKNPERSPQAHHLSEWDIKVLNEAYSGKQ